MIGRGHLTGPCPALSYVERAILVLLFFFFQKKISNFENNSSISIPIFFISVQSFPPFFPSLSPFAHFLPTVDREERPATAVLHARPATAVLNARPGVAVLHARPGTVVLNARPNSVVLPVPAATIRSPPSFSTSGQNLGFRRPISGPDFPHFRLWYRSPPFLRFFSCFQICFL